MKLLKYEDVVKAIDEHTNDDGRLEHVSENVKNILRKG